MEKRPKPEIVHEPLDGSPRPRSALPPLPMRRERDDWLWTVLVLLFASAGWIVWLLFRGFR